MTFIDQISSAFTPHRQALQESIGNQLCQIRQLLEHANRLSDLGRPDTDDTFLRIIRQAKIPTGQILLGRPRLGEYWLLQQVTSNGITGKSPAFVLRTNLGALIFASLAEATGQEPLHGLVVLPGEEIVFEAAAEGSFDFTIHAIRRKIPQLTPDAGEGVGQGDDINLLAHSGEYEPDRHLSEHHNWEGIPVEQEGVGGVAPEIYETAGPQE